MVDIIKVSAHSRSTAVAGAIAGVVREQKYADVQAIGAGSVNQAIKAIAIAHGYLEQDGLEIVCIPTFVQVDVSGDDRTAIKFSVQVQRETAPQPGSRMAEMNEPHGVQSLASPPERAKHTIFTSTM